MAKLFKDLVDYNLYNDWAELLDWLFNDDRFVNWSSGYVGALSKKIKRLDGFGNNSFVCDSYKNITFPRSTNRSIKVLMVKRDGDTKDIIRHIRNGIAHGKTKIIKKNGKLFIEINDYNKKHKQTAYIFIPVDYISKIHKLFLEVERSKNSKIKKHNSNKR